MGLNTTHDPRQLSAGFAVEANNVLLSEGRIRPRPPFVPFCSDGGQEYVVPNGGHIGGMIQIPRGQYDPPSVLAQVVPSSGYGSSLWRFDADGTAIQLADPGGGAQATLPWSFVQVGEWFVVLLAGLPVKTKGDSENTFSLSVPPPSASEVEQSIVSQGTANINATVEYAVTWYRSADHTESNPIIFGPFTPAAGEAVQFLVTQLPYTLFGVDEMRVYRKNISLGQVAYRLVGGVHTLWVGRLFWDGLAEDSITTSSADVGPFAPSRNGMAPGATCGAWHHNRLFVNKADVHGPNTSRVYYSGLGQPGSFYADDYLDVSGDGTEAVTGLITHAGQLVIGKPRSIWVLSGNILGATNFSAAVGAMPPVSHHTLHRTKATIGPINKAGNGFVMAGDSPAPHFAADGGFFAFDGLATIPLSTLIQPTWSAFVRRRIGDASKAAIAFAVDPANSVLYMTNVQHNASGQAAQVLAYHMRTGAWTMLDGDELPGAFEQVISIASALGDPTEEYRLAYAPLIVAGTKGSLRICRSVEGSDKPVAKWTWKTGRLTAIEGKRAHIYALEWFLPDCGPMPSGSPLVDLGFSLGKESQEHTRQVDIGGAVQFDQRVGATATDITLMAKSADAWTHGWKPELGILGFSIDAEVAGKR